MFPFVGCDVGAGRNALGRRVHKNALYALHIKSVGVDIEFVIPDRHDTVQ